MTANDLIWRVSVATLDRVIFQSPEDESLMLALERKATLASNTGGHDAIVRAQPFGGAVRIRNQGALHDLIGDFSFDSAHSQSEQDFRILIRTADWEPIKQFSLRHLQNPDDPVLESSPHRELAEEFADALKIDLQPSQYLYDPVGFVVENNPSPTDNVYGRGNPTVRIYRIFEVRIVDDSLRTAMLTTSERYTDRDLQTLALEDARNTGRGRANSILTIPLKLVSESYLAIPPEARYALGTVGGHQLDPSVLAVLDDVDAPQYQRL